MRDDDFKPFDDRPINIIARYAYEDGFYIPKDGELVVVRGDAARKACEELAKKLSILEPDYVAHCCRAQLYSGLGIDFIRFEEPWRRHEKVFYYDRLTPLHLAVAYQILAIKEFNYFSYHAGRSRKEPELYETWLLMDTAQDDMIEMIAEEHLEW